MKQALESIQVRRPLRPPSWSLTLILLPSGSRAGGADLSRGEQLLQGSSKTAPTNVENPISTDDSLELCLWYTVKWKKNYKTIWSQVVKSGHFWVVTFAFILLFFNDFLEFPKGSTQMYCLIAAQSSAWHKADSNKHMSNEWMACFCNQGKDWILCPSNKTPFWREVAQESA